MKKILVVEDQAFLMQVFYDKLKSNGFDVIQASNGQEGLDQALANHPDLIFLDIMMPVMDGITMLKHLRKDVWGQTAKVFILTNLSNSLYLENAKHESISDYLIKSNWTAEDLVNLAKKMLA